VTRFADKVVIVTGAASGIGAGAARRFAEEGARLILGDTNGDGLARMAASLQSDEVATHVTDVSDMAACEALVRFAIERFGRIDVVVNNDVVPFCWTVRRRG
jgi:meso-butanediol dehydrogenase / (S,S)-butanediol dehydrogenase / diacetyl reductase